MTLWPQSTSRAQMERHAMRELAVRLRDIYHEHTGCDFVVVAAKEKERP